MTVNFSSVVNVIMISLFFILGFVAAMQVIQGFGSSTSSGTGTSSTLNTLKTKIDLVCQNGDTVTTEITLSEDQKIVLESDKIRLEDTTTTERSLECSISNGPFTIESSNVYEISKTSGKYEIR